MIRLYQCEICKTITTEDTEKCKNCGCLSMNYICNVAKKEKE